jgi:hypothetical protein
LDDLITRIKNEQNKDINLLDKKNQILVVKENNKLQKNKKKDEALLEEFLNSKAK